jgi:hypothetical protein
MRSLRRCPARAYRSGIKDACPTRIASIADASQPRIDAATSECDAALVATDADLEAAPSAP